MCGLEKLHIVSLISPRVCKIVVCPVCIVDTLIVFELLPIQLFKISSQNSATLSAGGLAVVLSTKLLALTIPITACWAAFRHLGLECMQNGLSRDTKSCMVLEFDQTASSWARRTTDNMPKIAFMMALLSDDAYSLRITMSFWVISAKVRRRIGCDTDLMPILIRDRRAVICSSFLSVVDITRSSVVSWN